MKPLLRTALLVLAVWLQLSGISFAKQVYLKDGSILECESFWRRNGWVVVKVNRDILLEFTNAEIDLKKTFRKPTRPQQRIKKKKQTAPAFVAPAAKAAESPERAVLASVKSKDVSQDAPPAPAPKPAATTAQAEPALAKSTPAPAPTPVAAPAPESVAVPSQPEAARAAMTKEEYEKRSRENADTMAQAIKDNNPEQMKKALAAQQQLVKQKGAAQSGGSAQGEPGWFKYFLMLVASGLFIIIAMWVVFKKAGQAGWKSLVPIYNMYVLMQISGKPGWWSFVMLVPVVGMAVYLLAMLSLAEKFGRSAAYGVGLFLLPMFFFPMLAFGGAKYEEAIPTELEFTFTDEPLN